MLSLRVLACELSRRERIISSYIHWADMFSPEQFLQATGWVAIATVALGALTTIAFILKWGLRFRMVGATGLMGVLTVGLLGLSFQPFIRTAVPGAVPYETVFDSGAAQIVIKVPSAITATELEATLQQAASNLFKPSRLGSRGIVPTIRARAIVHKPGVSELVYVGQVTSDAPKIETSGLPEVKIFPERLAKANRSA